MQNSTFIFLSVLGSLMAVNSLATDVYLPALPTMTEVLGSGAELTISGYLLGFMVAQLVMWRVFQAIGACVGPMLSRAMVRDCYSLTEEADYYYGW